jgi:hypothetical protein
MTVAAPSLFVALDDPAVLGQFLSGPTWATWRVLLKAAFGVALTDLELEVFRRHTGRSAPNPHGHREIWVVAGRRSGKSWIASVIAVLLSCFRSYTLAPGETGVYMLLSQDRKQARVLMAYVRAIMRAVPMLEAMIANETRESIELTNGITISIQTSSFRSLRGFTVIGSNCDEVAFWRSDDSANPDTEILNALRPAMATVPDAVLMCISSPYARRGEMWRSHREHFGHDGDPVLVWQADTRSMNPTVDESIITRAYAEDESAASAEYGGQFRSDLEAFISREQLEALTITDRRELLPVPSIIKYLGFVDTAGGSGDDEMTAGIAHRERNGRVVLDALRIARPPFDPNTVTADFAAFFRTYRIHQITGDRYAGDWPVAAFRARGITFKHGEKSKSEIYGELLPLLNAGAVELIDVPKLRKQLSDLERRKTRGGREIIDHPPRAHDDLANAAAGAIVAAHEDGVRGPTAACIEVPRSRYGRY